MTFVIEMLTIRYKDPSATPLIKEIIKLIFSAVKSSKRI